jgi:hypothetical protein
MRQRNDHALNLRRERRGQETNVERVVVVVVVAVVVGASE